MIRLNRRHFLASLGAAGAAASGLAPVPSAAAPALIRRPIPSTGESIPVVGMGSWITFNVGDDGASRDALVPVLRTFFDLGGGMVDSSPMYGSAEDVIGYCLQRLENDASLFSATKVWTPLQWLGKRQMADSEGHWGIEKFDLMQIHNLVNWEGHLETLVDWKANGRVRYIGITTSHGSRHEEMERIMRDQPIDFVQFTYNVRDREVEARLLPLAAERGLGVIVNRPFRRGQLVDSLESKPLPDWAAEFDAQNWPQFLLKFIVSHPAVTCAIPATSQVEHMRENMGAATGRLPDAAMRERMIRYVESL